MLNLLETMLIMTAAVAGLRHSLSRHSLASGSRESSLILPALRPPGTWSGITALGEAPVPHASICWPGAGAEPRDLAA